MGIDCKKLIGKYRGYMKQIDNAAEKEQQENRRKMKKKSK